MELHPALAELAPLIGTWRGEGRGEYPTIAPFDYGEEVVVTPARGKPYLVYEQRTFSLATGAPMHRETGYWRGVGPGRVEVVLAHPFGAVEVLEGTVADGVLRLASTSVRTTSSAKAIERIERDVEVAGEDLRYVVRMAAVGLPLQHHLAATLHRVAPQAQPPTG
jgi:hypothetical protein